MATRKQPARRVKRRLDSGLQSKKRKAPSVPQSPFVAGGDGGGSGLGRGGPKIHSEPGRIEVLEWPIPSSSASSFSGPNMGDPHIWTHEEEMALFPEADALLKAQSYSRKSHLYEDLMKALNLRFPNVAVKFTSKNIKNKVDIFKSRWISGRSLLTCNQEKIECSEAVAKFLFTGTSCSASQNSVGAASMSVSVNNGKIPADSMSVNNSKIPTMQECTTLVESVEGLTPIEKADVIELIRLDLAVRETLMSFRDKEVRLCWIRKRIGPLNNPGTA